MIGLRVVGQRLLAVFSSLTMAGVLLALLALLTFLGTLAQTEHGLYDVQRTYFESIFFLHEVGNLSFPLPGGGLVMGLLFINLSVGGVMRLRKGARTAGVLVAHLGMLLMLAAGFVKYATGEEGHVTLYEGRSADWFQSYTETELAVVAIDGGLPASEWTVAADHLRTARPRSPVVTSGFPFRLEVTHWFENADVTPKGPMFEVDVPVVDGYFLRGVPKDPQVERNGQGAYVVVTGSDGIRRTGILWAFSAAPWTIEIDGQKYTIDLRRARHPMPFSVRLDVFKKENHPGTTMPAWFSSDVQITNQGVPRPVTISMNEPLREDGLVLYQASWGPSNARPGTPLFSTLAVVRNPSDQWPLVSCVVIAAGLLFHFGRMLVHHVRREAVR